MKYLGIDYGTKKIGLAISDETGKVAFPYSIIATADKELEIEKVIAKEKIGEIVIGKSTDLKGQSNKVQEDIDSFAAIIGMQYGLPVHFVKEFFSSSEARHAEKRAGAKASANIDDKAAVIILQRHLDTIQLKRK